MQDLHMLLDAARRWRSWKVTKRDLLVASTRQYPRPPCVSSFVKSRMLRPFQIHFLLFQQIFLVFVGIYPGNARVPLRVLASGQNPAGATTFAWLINIFLTSLASLTHSHHSFFNNACRPKMKLLCYKFRPGLIEELKKKHNEVEWWLNNFFSSSNVRISRYLNCPV